MLGRFYFIVFVRFFVCSFVFRFIFFAALLINWAHFRYILNNFSLKPLLNLSRKYLFFSLIYRFLFVFIKLSKVYFCHSFLEIDECSQGSHTCDVNAYCNNTVGSYRCTCKPHYYGNGEICKTFGKL